MAAHLEDVSQSVQRGLHKLDESQAILAAEQLQIPKAGIDKVRGRGRMGVIRLVNRYLVREEVEEMEDGGLEELQGLDAFIVQLLGTKEESDKDQQLKDEKKEGQPPKSAASSPPSQGQETEMAYLSRLMKRDFKITGQIGEPGQKDKITFSSLNRQLEAGLQKGYEEKEIVEAVIRSISPGMRLRSYLEGKSTLSLETLREILQVHFREGDATTLFKELSSATQGINESAQDFLVRILDIRQKIIQASSKVDATISYDPGLVQQMFVNSLGTGLRSDGVRMDMRALLVNPFVSDEALFRQIKGAEEQETERKIKLKQHHTAKVHQVSTQEKEKEENLAKQLRQIQADLAALKAATSEVKTQNSSQTKSSVPKRKPEDWGCRACREAGVGTSCRHCFHCGAEDHILRGCRLRKMKQQENGQGAPRWDEGRPQRN